MHDISDHSHTDSPTLMIEERYYHNYPRYLIGLGDRYCQAVTVSRIFNRDIAWPWRVHQRIDFYCNRPSLQVAPQGALAGELENPQIQRVVQPIWYEGLYESPAGIHTSS